MCDTTTKVCESMCDTEFTYTTTKSYSKDKIRTSTKGKLIRSMLTLNSETTSKNNKIIDFTQNLLYSDFHSEFISTIHKGIDGIDGDLFWWGTCIVTFKFPFKNEDRVSFKNRLKDIDLFCTIIDNISDREFLIFFNYIDYEKDPFKLPIIIRKGYSPCISLLAERKSEHIQWYHFINCSNETRCFIAKMYRNIYELFKDEIDSIEIVRDLHNKDYILV